MMMRELTVTEFINLLVDGRLNIPTCDMELILPDPGEIVGEARGEDASRVLRGLATDIDEARQADEGEAEAQLFEEKT